MKTGQFIIFLGIVLTVYAAVNWYIFIRGCHALPSGSAGRIWYAFIFWLLASTFVAARILERTWPCTFTEVITWIGSFWLAAMLFLFLFVAAVDLFRLSDRLFHWFPAFITQDPARTKIVLFWAAGVFTLIQGLAGYINARSPVVSQLTIELNKPLPGGTLKLAVASDIHLGTIIGKRKAEKLVEMMNGLQADVILFPGDIVDEDIAPVIRNDLGSSLLKLKAPYGVWAVTGNHEFIGGAGKSVKYLKEHGIRFLHDTSTVVEGIFTLAGRDDRDMVRFTGKPRKPLDEVLSGADPALPLILMDHQPFHLDSVAKAGVDLQLSGHTHHGQIWPFNYITKAMYRVSRGYHRIANTHFYVSCGYGTWGPPIRLGNRPEVILITLTGPVTHKPTHE